MIPIVIYSPQPTYSSQVMSEQPMVADHLFLAEVNSLMNGKDMRNAAPIAWRFLAKRLVKALDASVGSSSTQHTTVVPLVEKSEDPSAHDTLRALMVVVCDMDSIEESQAQPRAEGFVRRWRQATGGDCAFLSEEKNLAASQDALVARCQLLAAEHDSTSYTWAASKEIDTAMGQAIRPLEAMLQSGALTKLTPNSTIERAAQPMIPLILHAEHNYNIPGALSCAPMYFDQQWVVDLNAYIGRDVRNATPDVHRLIIERLRETLLQVLGENIGTRARVMPLFEPTQPLETPLVPGQTDTRPDYLRGMVVRLGDLPACDFPHLAEFAQELASRWQDATGQECAVLSHMGEFDIETKKIERAIKRNVQRAGDDFQVSGGIEVNEDFDATLRAIEPCVKSSELNRRTIEASAQAKQGRRI